MAPAWRSGNAAGRPRSLGGAPDCPLLRNRQGWEHQIVSEPWTTDAALAAAREGAVGDHLCAEGPAEVLRQPPHN